MSNRFAERLTSTFRFPPDHVHFLQIEISQSGEANNKSITIMMKNNLHTHHSALPDLVSFAMLVSTFPFFFPFPFFPFSSSFFPSSLSYSFSPSFPPLFSSFPLSFFLSFSLFLKKRKYNTIISAKALGSLSAIYIFKRPAPKR